LANGRFVQVLNTTATAQTSPGHVSCPASSPPVTPKGQGFVLRGGHKNMKTNITAEEKYHEALLKVRDLAFRHNKSLPPKSIKSIQAEATLAQILGWKSNDYIKRIFEKCQIEF
jgi:hypothetical protein